MTNITYPDLNIRWLIDPASAEPASVVPAVYESHRLDFPLPPEIGYGWLERMPLAQGVMVMQGVHRFRPEVSGQLIPLGEFKYEFPEMTLAMQTVQGGTVCHREFYPPAELIYKPGYDFFRHADRFHTIPLIDTSSNSEMTSLNVGGSALAGLIGEDLKQLLIDGLGLSPQPVVKVMPVPLHVSAPLRACLSPTLTGPLRRLFAQAKVLEYLCALSVHVSTPSSVKLQTDHKRNVVRELHDYLMQLEGKLPTLDELTLRYGISARWLNDAFVLEYGETIYSFITCHRLNESHAALLEGNLAIKIISARLGYSHVNHFTIAFKKKFGYPPGSLRRGRQIEDLS